jgi:hypothetical protein
MVTIRVYTQYLENYSDKPDYPHWKKKGGYTFTIKNVDSNLVTYCNNLGKILKALTEAQSNEHCKYEYLEHEIDFFTEDLSITGEVLTKAIIEYEKE